MESGGETVCNHVGTTGNCGSHVVHEGAVDALQLLLLGKLKLLRAMTSFTVLLESF